MLQQDVISSHIPFAERMVTLQQFLFRMRLLLWFHAGDAWASSLTVQNFGNTAPQVSLFSFWFQLTPLSVFLPQSSPIIWLQVDTTRRGRVFRSGKSSHFDFAVKISLRSMQSSSVTSFLTNSNKPLVSLSRMQGGLQWEWSWCPGPNFCCSAITVSNDDF